MVRYGLGRKISVKETLQILKKANREGLVHVVENHSGRVSVLCNCWNDWCMWFRSIYEAKHPNALAKSSYYAEVDTEKCVACGICAIRCPMHAITVKRKKRKEDSCLVDWCFVLSSFVDGCGNCKHDEYK